MGPYCNFCDHRCFVRLPDGTPERFLETIRSQGFQGGFIMATCHRGKAFEREKLGFDIDAIREAIAKAEATPEPSHSRKMCEVCGNFKVPGSECHGEDRCEYGPDGGPAETCEGWGRYCCRCGAAFARNQM